MGYLLSLQPTFTQGLVFGQLSIFLLLALVLKYLFLVSQPSPAHHHPTTVPARLQAKHEPTPLEDEAESSEWLNLVLREVVQTYRSELRDNHAGSEGDESARVRVERRLNALRPANFVDPIVVHSVDLGSDAPRLSNVRINPLQGSRETQQVELDMTYTDTTSISLSTSVLFNYPLSCFARLPVSLTISLSMFSSKISLTPPCPTSPTPSLTISLPKQFNLDLHISSLLGSRAKLADVPKLHDMIESQIKRALADRGAWTIVLPSLTRPQRGVDTRAGDEIDVKLVHEGLGRPPDDILINGLSI